MLPSDILSSVRSGFRRLKAIRRSVTRYDLHLAMIPSAFGLALLASAVLDAPTNAALPTAAAVGALVIFDGLFRNPPTTGSGLR